MINPIQLDSKNKKSDIEREQIRKGRDAGKKACKLGIKKFSKEELKMKCRSDEYIQAYYEGYESFKKNTKTIKIARREYLIGIECPTQEVLKERGYTDEAVEAFLNFWAEPPALTEAINTKKAEKNGKDAVNYMSIPPTMETLLIRGYNEKNAQVYLNAFNRAFSQKVDRLKNTVTSYNDESEPLSEGLLFSSQKEEHSLTSEIHTLYEMYDAEWWVKDLEARGNSIVSFSYGSLFSNKKSLEEAIKEEMPKKTIGTTEIKKYGTL